MSTEELQSDYKANQAQVAALGAMSSTADVISFIKNTLWPFIGNVVSEVEAMDEAMQDLVDGAEDILHEETAQVLASAIVASVGLVGELEKRLKLPEDANIAKAIKAWRKMANAATTLLEEITIADPDPDDDEEDDDEDDEDVEGHESADTASKE